MRLSTTTQFRRPKDEWLRSQKEHAQLLIVNVNQGLSVAPSLYFSTRRCTYSQVMSVVTTVRPLPRLRVDDKAVIGMRADVSQAAASPSPPLAQASSPTTSLKPRDGAPIVSTTTSGPGRRESSSIVAPVMPHHEVTLAWQPKANEAAGPVPLHDNSERFRYVDAPLEGDSLRAQRLHARQHFALTAERDAFMTALWSRRRQRFALETRAALAIQRVYRGHQLRLRFLEMKDRLRVRKRVRGSLIKVTKGTAIVTAERERRARLQEQQRQAACRLQRAFQRWIAWKVLARERCLRRWEHQRAAAIVVQRQWRRAMATVVVAKLRSRHRDEQGRHLAAVLSRLFLGYCARQSVRRIRLRRQTVASQRLQQFVQRVHARKALALERRRQRESRSNTAACTIQRLVRGVLARALVLRLRFAEDRAIRVACALTIQRVFRGAMGRRHTRFHRAFAAYRRATVCALHVTRVVRGFLARRAVELLRIDQETDLLVQTRCGNTSTVIDLLDGFGIVDEPVDVTTTRVETRNNVLHVAAKFGRLEILTHVLRMVLERAPSMLYALNARGETPLELAICHGHDLVASFLLTKTTELYPQAPPAPLERRVLVRQPGRERSLLLDAARQGMSQVVAKLVMFYPQVFAIQVRDSWSLRTVLHEAVLLPRDRYERDAKTSAERDDVVATLLRELLSKQSGLDINARDLVGFTPLHLAARLGNLRAVKVLLELGADTTVQDHDGRETWRLAGLFGHTPCFLEIRRKWLSDGAGQRTGASDNAGAENDDEKLGNAITRAASKSRRLGLHSSLARDVCEAGRAGQLERLRFLTEEMETSVNATDPNGDGDSLLMIVMAHKQFAVLRYLVKMWGDELDVSYVNRAGVAVADVALRNPNTMALLVRSGLLNPCLAMSSLDGHRTACHEAARRGYDLKAWLNGFHFMPRMLASLADDSGRTPLHDAVAFGNVDSALLLIHSGVRIEQQSEKDGRTALHEACQVGDARLVRRMIRYCPQAIWIHDNNGALPIETAVVVAKNEECAQTLAERMATHAPEQWRQVMHRVREVSASTQDAAAIALAAKLQ
ncbi:hypothetical protein P43SY_000576 [Pythium insidiosum]|uniref:Uncharacterized protein n=1 Tax=Pythium insidiosum TaxID=114742 RepID=A0AAD5LUZ4_PYTIN|nr:hypothetical protein P43SY_000576 [Pythium insidiosum]